MKLTGAQILCETLMKEGVSVMYGIPGGASLPFYQTLPQYPQIKHVLVRHECAAAMAADAYARVTGKVGVCCATSGPGATNLVTGLAGAQMDSVPVVALTAQVARASIGRDAFQETDITGVTLPVVKHNYLVMKAEDIASTVQEAFYLARSGRPGVVLVDIPKDVLAELATPAWSAKVDIPSYRPTMDGHPAMVKRAAELLNGSHRPVVLAGHGIILSGAYDEVRQLAEKAQVPVITTLLGISAFPSEHILYAGWPGMHGMAHASMAINEADLLIALGMRFDDRVTGDLKRFASAAKVVHVDIDPSEIGKNRRADVPVVGDLKRVLTQMLPHVHQATHVEWLQRIEQLRREHPLYTARETEKVLPQEVMRTLSELTEGRAYIVTGVGQHQMWAAQHYTFRERNHLVTHGGLGSMGFEVPAAVGAQMGRPDAEVWSICGDGGFQMTMMELATVMEQDLPIKYLIMNNGFLGMVRQWQDLFYQKSYVATHYSGNPDFVKLAAAYGMRGIRVTRREELKPALTAAREHQGPVLIDCVIEPEENVFPMIPAGQSVQELMEQPKSEVAQWRR